MMVVISASFFWKYHNFSLFGFAGSQLYIISAYTDSSENSKWKGKCNEILVDENGARCLFLGRPEE